MITNDNLLSASLSGPVIDMPVNVRALILDKHGNIKQEVVKHNKATRNMTEGIIRFLRGEFTETFVRDFKPTINNIGYDKDKAREFIPTHIGIGNIGINRNSGSECGKIDSTFTESDSNNFYNTIYSPSYSDTCLRSEILPYYNRHRSLIQKSVKGDSSASDAYELVVQGYYQFNQSLSTKDTLVNDTIFDKTYFDNELGKTFTINELIDSFDDETKFSWSALNNNTGYYSFRISNEFASETKGHSAELKLNINNFGTVDVGFKTTKPNMSLQIKGDGIRFWNRLNIKNITGAPSDTNNLEILLNLKVNNVNYVYQIPKSDVSVNQEGRYVHVPFKLFADNEGNNLILARSGSSSNDKITEISFKISSSSDLSNSFARHTLYIDDLSFYDEKSQFNFIYADTRQSSYPTLVEKFLEVDNETGESVECITVTELGLFSGDIESKGINTRLLARVLLDPKNPLILSENDTMIVNWQIGVYSLNDNLDAGNVDYKYVTKPVSEYSNQSPFTTIELDDIK